MEKFLERFGEHVNGVITGFDRLAIRGSIRWLGSIEGLRTYLGTHKILLKDFSSWAQSLTSCIRRSCEEVASQLGIPKIYLQRSSIDKEELARSIARDRSIDCGPICMFSVVEPSFSPTVVGSKEKKLLAVEMRHRKCVWIYFYFNHPKIGFGHLRLESWLPFTIKGAINGRHWLERSLAEQKIDFVKSDNCFRWIDDPQRAQQLLDAQLSSDWPGLFNGLVDQFFPVMRQLFAPDPLSYYWSCDATEVATDVMFRSTPVLDQLFPVIARHALTITDSANVMRFLGRIDKDASLPGRLTGDIRGDRVRRYEGICVKHRDGTNSVKTYNKAGNVLRVETTINDTRAFKVFRQANDEPSREATWLKMRKGVADLQRRCAISKACNERYLDALASCPSECTFAHKVQQVCRKTQLNGRSVRALNPCSANDLKLFQFLAQGQWAINGFQNRDLARWTTANIDDLPHDERRKLSARTSHLLHVLRAHHLIRKVPRSHRYQITPKGKEIAALVIAASNAQAEKLIEIAA